MDILIVALLVLGSAAWLFYKKTRRVASTSNHPTLRLQGGGTYEHAVLGVARYRPALEKICDVDQRDPKTVEALLVPEDANPRDKKAVRVEVQGHTVGYLPTELAEAYRTRLVESGYPGARSICKAKIIVRMHSSLGGHADYSVRLDLPQKRSSGR
jgi:HIRAN domain-containing protein